jgi:hypothetical protein
MIETGHNVASGNPDLRRAMIGQRGDYREKTDRTALRPVVRDLARPLIVGRRDPGSRERTGHIDRPGRIVDDAVEAAVA